MGEMTVVMTLEVRVGMTLEDEDEREHIEHSAIIAVDGETRMAETRGDWTEHPVESVGGVLDPTQAQMTVSGAVLTFTSF